MTDSAGSSQTFRPRLMVAAVLFAVVTAGLLNAPYPFNGDQALFAVGAKALASGPVLYRDFWDLKQPGIYWFYHLAGSVTGYTSSGIHLGELVWFSILTVVMVQTLRGRFAAPGTAGVAVLLTVVVYFAVCGVWDLTQLEGLVALPLLISLIRVIPKDASGRPTAVRWFGFGVMLGVVGLFKLLLIALPLSFAVVAVWPRGLADVRASLERGLRGIFPAVAGTALVWGPALAYFGLEHQLPLLWQTFVIDPPRILREVPTNGVIVLIRSCRWFLLAGGPLMPFALIALICRWRRATRFEWAVAVWIVVATVLVMIQRMWWQYHFLLILFPLGLAAAMGLENVRAWSRSPRRRRVGRIVMAVAVFTAFFPYALRLGLKAVLEARDLRKPQGWELFAAEIGPSYSDAADEAQWINQHASPAAVVYVLGDPQIMYLSGRPQPVPINGWSPEWFLPQQWAELVKQINDRRPDFIFVSHYNDELLSGRGAIFARLIDEQYSARHDDMTGVWYVRNAK